MRPAMSQLGQAAVNPKKPRRKGRTRVQNASHCVQPSLYSDQRGVSSWSPARLSRWLHIANNFQGPRQKPQASSRKGTTRCCGTVAGSNVAFLARWATKLCVMVRHIEGKPRLYAGHQPIGRPTGDPSAWDMGQA